jgi:hypothetical protein
VLPIDGVVIDTRRAGDRIVTITWKREIKPRETANFTFMAKNSAMPTTVMWKAHQHFADGTTADWIGATGDRQPAAVTRITAGK